MELWELDARASILDLIARFNANGDANSGGDPDAAARMLELFAPDAVMELPDGSRYEGHDAIATVFAGTRGRLASLAPPGGEVYLRHLTSTHQIDVVDESHATCRCYNAVLMPHGLDHWGRYLDRFERRDGRWLLTHRRVLLDGYVSGGLGAAFNDR